MAGALICKESVNTLHNIANKAKTTFTRPVGTSGIVVKNSHQEDQSTTEDHHYSPSSSSHHRRLLVVVWSKVFYKPPDKTQQIVDAMAVKDEWKNSLLQIFRQFLSPLEWVFSPLQLPDPNSIVVKSGQSGNIVGDILGAFIGGLIVYPFVLSFQVGFQLMSRMAVLGLYVLVATIIFSLISLLLGSTMGSAVSFSHAHPTNIKVSSVSPTIGNNKAVDLTRTTNDSIIAFGLRLLLGCAYVRVVVSALTEGDLTLGQGLRRHD